MPAFGDSSLCLARRNSSQWRSEVQPQAQWQTSAHYGHEERLVHKSCHALQHPCAALERERNLSKPKLVLEDPKQRFALLQALTQHGVRLLLQEAAGSVLKTWLGSSACALASSACALASANARLASEQVKKDAEKAALDLSSACALAIKEKLHTAVAESQNEVAHHPQKHPHKIYTTSGFLAAKHHCLPV